MSWDDANWVRTLPRVGHLPSVSAQHNRRRRCRRRPLSASKPKPQSVRLAGSGSTFGRPAPAATAAPTASPTVSASSTANGVWMPPTTRLNSAPLGPLEACEKLSKVSTIGQISGLPLLTPVLVTVLQSAPVSGKMLVPSEQPTGRSLLSNTGVVVALQM